MTYLNCTFELLAGGYYKGNSSWNKRHSEVDNNFKLYVLTEGEACICDKNNEHVLQHHKIYFINGNKLESQYCSNRFSTYWLHFLPKDLLVYRALLSLPTVIEIPDDNGHLSPLIDNASILLNTFDLPLKERTLKKLELQKLLLTTVIELLQSYTVNLSADIDKIDRINPAILYINEHFKETILLKDLAQLCYMSKTYFHKTFKNVLDITPTAYQTRLRMNAALELLNNKNIPVKEIASELGFTDTSHFCNSFKLYYGIPPKKYQKQEKETLIP